ncbi:MAG: S8 family serine peptidase, partial [Thermoplasmata archaeon]|nr:S8 family serine peptidase [Thermoplasmata archaeon]
MRRNISIALSILLASLFLFQPVVSAETRNTVLAVPSYGTPQSGQIVEGGPWWLVTSMDENRNGIFEYLEEMMERRETLDVFVDYDHTPTSEDVERLEEMGLETTGIVMLGRAIGVRGIESGKIPVVARLPHVVMVEPKMHSFLLSDVATPNAKVQPSKYSPETAWELGYEGGGVNIAIVDTGIDDSHPSLTDKWVAGVEFSHPVADVVRPKDGSFNPDDVNGHGTTCAGIATGTGAPDAKFMGAAPNASLVDVRIGTAVGFAPGEIVRPDEPISIVMDGDG